MGSYIRVATGGGGGYGDPADRDPSLHADDLLNSYVTV